MSLRLYHILSWLHKRSPWPIILEYYLDAVLMIHRNVILRQAIYFVVLGQIPYYAKLWRHWDSGSLLYYNIQSPHLSYLIHRKLSLNLPTLQKYWDWFS